MTRLLGRLGRRCPGVEPSSRQRRRPVWPDLVRAVTAAVAISTAALQLPTGELTTASPPAAGRAASAGVTGRLEALATDPTAPTDVARTRSAAASSEPRSYPRILIPSIGVDAYLESVGLDGLRRVATPRRPEDAAWYSPGPAPGQPGDAIIDGHLDSPAGVAVFSKLGRLRPGSLVIIDSGGSITTFRVSSLEVYGFAEHPLGLFSRSGPPRLTLITCFGAWDQALGTYQQRLLVESALAE